jgi:hypothetical protein
LGFGAKPQPIFEMAAQDNILTKLHDLILYLVPVLAMVNR